jgi:dUTP pyrophosphatase
MKIKIVNTSKHEWASYSTDSAEGTDLRADTDEDIVLKPLSRALRKKGLFLVIPVEYKAQIRPGSRLAFNKGITVQNSPGTIDSGYRGEVCIIMVNLSEDNYVIRDGERICRMGTAKHGHAEWVTVESLLDTSSGDRGFGHIGKK